MRTLLLLLALLLAGCERQPVPAPEAPSAMFTDDQRREFSAMQTDAHGAWLAAIEGETNRAAILARFDAAMDERIIELLADTDSRAGLLGKLDSLARGSNRHKFTKAQLEGALKLKEQREASRKKK